MCRENPQVCGGGSKTFDGDVRLGRDATEDHLSFNGPVRQVRDAVFQGSRAGRGGGGTSEVGEAKSWWSDEAATLMARRSGTTSCSQVSPAGHSFQRPA